MTCTAIIASTGRREAAICGRAIKGYVAKGEGRCGYHLITKERVGAANERRRLLLEKLAREFVDDSDCGCGPGECEADCWLRRFREVLES